ncbi:unnamed protein product [Parnassius apollo]|uniref:(apollo) hypothetical protein n=1 Tax=Parnassius apollo TaxID=110799 RepID=A0A8S3XI56_PARAO|nr:unnamed protein product [Parnassius apollo]
MLAKCFNAWILFLLCFVFVKFHCQICTKRVVVTRLQQQSYRHTYRETYRGQCWYGCTKTRIRSFTDNRLIPRKIVETREICCNGYIDVSNTSERIECKPICMPSCVNSTCQIPGVCTCYDGYKRDAVSSHICKPTCSNDCLHGTCVAPNVCQCNFGYREKNQTCEPICTEYCYNGTCVAPDTCECLPGFRSSENNECKPYCFSGCPNGECIGPEICNCNTGWLKNETSNSCVPQCEIPCGNGTCISPNKCECFNGYVIDPNYNDTLNSMLCVPKCNNCVNGTCIAPDECICEPPLISKTLTNSAEECDCVNSNTSLKCEGTICVLAETKPSTTAPYSTTEDLITNKYEFYSENGPSESTTELSATTMYFNFSNASSKEVLLLKYLLPHESDKKNLTTSSTESSIFVETTHEIHYYNNNMNITKNYVSMKNKNNSNWTSMWIYVLIALFVLIVLLVIIVVAKKNSIAIWFKGGSYEVQDNKFKNISSPSQAVDMSYTNVRNRNKVECK